jgi:high-affinity iron transporter
MSASLLLVMRETVEASLLIGILFACLERTENRRYFAGVWAGAGAGTLVSVLLGATLFLTLGSVAGPAREALEGAVMWVAAAVLTYVIWWMRREGGSMAHSLRTEAAAGVGRGSVLALGTLAFLAVFREGAEAVLYLGAAASNSPWERVILGASMGFAAAVLIGSAMYRGGTRLLSPQRFFAVTSALLLLFAAGMVGRATLAFQAAGVFPGTVTAWNASAVLPDTGSLGQALQALFGYTATPSVLQVIFVLGYVALILALQREAGRQPSLAASRFRSIGLSYRHPLYRALRSRRLRTIAPASMLALLAGILVAALLPIEIGPFDNQGALHLGPFSNAETQNNIFNFLLWIVWLPLLTVLTVAFGRFWCGFLCPLRLTSEWAHRLGAKLGLGSGRVSAPLRLGWLLPSSFLLVTLVVKGLDLQGPARAGAVLFLAIFALATVIGFVSRRGAWCRYFCPVGGWLGRATRLSPLALQADRDVCATCVEKPCLKGSELAGRCPSFLNPLQLETSRSCIKCADCVVNCPADRSSLKLGWRPPGAELLEPRAPDLWESLFVASLLGMYMAAGHRSPALAAVPWPALFAGFVALAMLVYVVACALASRLAGVPLRRALTTFGYLFLPLEFATALIAFGDDSLEFFGIAQPAAVVLLATGFVWSVVVGVSIVRSQARGGLRAIATAAPLAVILVSVLMVWLSWYASGGVVDVT